MKLTAFFLMLISFFGCTPVLTAKKVQNVQKIYVIDKFDNMLQYYHLGTTVFGTYSFKIENIELYQLYKKLFINELEERGYKLVDSLEDSDIGIRLEQRGVYSYPSGTGVRGLGFYAQTFMGQAWAFQAQVSISATFIDAVSGKDEQMRTTLIRKSSSTSKFVKDWSEYSAHEKEQLLGLLELAIKEAYKPHIDMLMLQGYKASGG